MPAAPVTPIRAWVRPPSSAMSRCLRRSAVPIDPTAALREHAGYVAALRDAGIEVVELAPATEHPDATFVEDTAVLLGDVALLTRPGAEARRDEVETVAAALEPVFRIERMEAPAALDGGDVLRVGDRLWVGLSSRSNEAGARRLAEVAAGAGLSVGTLVVERSLHLKSVCTALDADTIVYDASAISSTALGPLAPKRWSVPEPAGANILPLSDRVLCSADAPETADRLEHAGHRIVRVPLHTMHDADGALTCLSLRQAPPGRWSA